MIRDTPKLIKNIQPRLNPGQYVFHCAPRNLDIPAEQVICMFREPEGITYVLGRKLADELKLEYDFVAAWITLNVYSSLEAVGLTAKVSNALAAENISCNAIAAYHHDHIFVPYKDGERAISILRKL
ncbi:MAG: ACT domain-containing protein [Bacteroidales bacterium]|nr:ACT domain-containing protein [Bacteroidales bacterium]